MLANTKHIEGDFRLLVITPDQTLPGEQALVRSLFRAGLTSLHLRKPGMDAEELNAYLDYFTPAEISKIRVHGTDFSLLDKGIAGLHVPFPALRRFSRSGASITTSIHNWQEYGDLKNGIEYALISPIYNSLSKPGYFRNPSNWNLPPVQHVPVIALGGIHGGNIASLVQGRFSGAALLGAIWQQPEKSVQVFDTVKKQIASLYDNEK